MTEFIELFNLDDFESDDDFFTMISRLDSKQLLEYVIILERMSQMWPCSLNIKYLTLIFLNPEKTQLLSIEYRLELAKSLLSLEKDVSKIETLVLFLLEWMLVNDALHISTIFSMYEFLFSNCTDYEYIGKIQEYLYRNITHPRLSHDIQCKFLFKCESMIPKTAFSEFLIVYYKSELLPQSFKFLVCQYILNNIDKLDNLIIKIELILIDLQNILLDTRELMYVKTDVADMILGIPDDKKDMIPPELRTLAIQTIMDAGGNRHSFYHNNENVHSIDQISISHVLQKLYDKYYKSSRSIDSDVRIVKSKCVELKRDANRIDLALIRIQLDNQLYNNYKLSNIFQLILSYILDHKDLEEELWKRLLEELEDMADKCTTGYVLRLINTLSGFDDSFGIQISHEERFKSIFYHKLNQHIEKANDNHDILYELTISSSLPEDRKNFLEFFIKVFPLISTEMYAEFQNELSETDIELYLRKAYYDYETGS